MRIFILFFLIFNLGFASEYKKIGLIPADVNYDKSSVEEFSEILYDAIANAIAEYNFSQKNTHNMYKISETVIIKKAKKRYKEVLSPSKKFKKEIKESHAKIKKDFVTYMKKRDLAKLLVMDFSTAKVSRMMSKCKGVCSVDISLVKYTSDVNNSKPLKSKLNYKYSGVTCQLTDKSSNELNKKIESLLR